MHESVISLIVSEHNLRIESEVQYKLFCIVIFQPVCLDR